METQSTQTEKIEKDFPEEVMVESSLAAKRAFCPVDKGMEEGIVRTGKWVCT